MRVKATEEGFYGTRLIRPGEVFELIDIRKNDRKSGKIVVKTKAEDQFSEKWMTEDLNADIDAPEDLLRHGKKKQGIHHPNDDELGDLVPAERQNELLKMKSKGAESVSLSADAKGEIDKAMNALAANDHPTHSSKGSKKSHDKDVI